MYNLAVGLVVVLVITLILLLVSHYVAAFENQKNMMMIASYVFVGVSILLGAYIANDVQQLLQTQRDNLTFAYNMNKQNEETLISDPQAGNFDYELNKAIDKMVLPPPPPLQTTPEGF
jgi:hypothetical protein